MDNAMRVQRAIKRVSQRDVAWAVGVREQSIHAIENNKAMPSLGLGMKIALYFNVPVEELFFLDDEEKFIKQEPAPAR